MAFRFQKRVKLFPGLRLNLSKTGVSVSAHAGGLTINKNKNGYKGTIGLRGTGLSYSTEVKTKRAPPSQSKPSVVKSSPRDGLSYGDGAINYCSKRVDEINSVLVQIQPQINSARGRFDRDMMSLGSLSIAEHVKAKFYNVLQDVEGELEQTQEKLMRLQNRLKPINVGMFDWESRAAKRHVLRNISSDLSSSKQLTALVTRIKEEVDNAFLEQTAHLRKRKQRRQGNETTKRKL